MSKTYRFVEPLSVMEPDAIILGFWMLSFKLTFSSGPITSWQIDGEPVETVTDFIFGAPKSLQMVTSAMKLKDASSLK